jgi:hypothetical protein
MSDEEQQQQQNTQDTEPKQEDANATINIKVLSLSFSPLHSQFLSLLRRDAHVDVGFVLRLSALPEMRFSSRSSGAPG